MFPFRSKFDPFSSFTINLGPLYVQRVFDTMLGIHAVAQLTATQRFNRYLEYLKKKINVHNHTQYAVTQFYKGYFCQQLAVHAEKALCYYQNYLELAERKDESRYYAQWQAGMLQDALHHPWSLVEESLQAATTLDPLRAEALKKMIEHYIATRDWKKAYPLSKMAVEKYFDKNPVAHRRWFVDVDAYNWSVLTRHHTICLYLGYVREAEEADNRKKIVIVA